MNLFSIAFAIVDHWSVSAPGDFTQNHGIYLSIHPSIYLSTYYLYNLSLFIYQSIIYLSIYLPIDIDIQCFAMGPGVASHHCLNSWPP